MWTVALTELEAGTSHPHSSKIYSHRINSFHYSRDELTRKICFQLRSVRTDSLLGLVTSRRIRITTTSLYSGDFYSLVTFARTIELVDLSEFTSVHLSMVT